jgi:hypothetical protein
MIARRAIPMSIEILLTVIGLMLPVVGALIGVFVRNETRAAKLEQRIENAEDSLVKGDGVIEQLREAIVDLKVAIQSLITMNHRGH